MSSFAFPNFGHLGTEGRSAEERRETFLLSFFYFRSSVV